MRPQLILPILTACGIASAAPGDPSFRHEIMPLFSRAGCNTGACHGSAGGKGNLRLSLRGENPAQDFATLTQNRSSSRLNTAEPQRSQLLRKPAELTEHEGGLRLPPDSDDFRLLESWIRAGAPDDPPDAPVLTGLRVTSSAQLAVDPVHAVQLQATATFSDGSTRDVTGSAVYELSNLIATVSRSGAVTARKHGETNVIVRFEHLQRAMPLAFVPARPGFAFPDTAENNFIDGHIFRRLRELQTAPAGLCDDATFLRRASFDLTGQLPEAGLAKRFLADADPGKRMRLVDELLTTPAFADWWALKWADLLRLEERVMDVTGTAAMHRWLRDAMARDLPADQLVRTLLTTEGSSYQQPAANYWRVLRDASQRAEATAQVFLGTRIGCARCHNHPFERWTQDDYYRFAAIFDGIGYDILSNRRRDENDRMEFVGEQVISFRGSRELRDPRNDSSPLPAMLGGQPTTTGPERLAELARWLTSPEHPLFAKVHVNRVWAALFGRGLVDPVDDFRMTNPPSHPGLLDELAAEHVRGGFRLRPLLRLLCASRTYQLSAEPAAGTSPEIHGFAHALIRRLPAEVLLDASHTALGVPLTMRNFPDSRSAIGIPGARFITKSKRADATEAFLKEFGKPPRATSCECERTTESSLAQVFTLTSGPLVNGLLRHESNRLTQLLREGVSPEGIVDDLFWRFLSRPPSETETARFFPLLSDSATRRASMEDLAWSLLNAKEFLLRR
jgi:hypothetical protein